MKFVWVLITVLSLNAFGLTYKSDNFTVEYDANVSKEIVAKLATQIEKERAIVLNYLNQSTSYHGTPIKEPLIVYISKKKRIPYQDWNTIHLPEKRVLQTFSEEVLSEKVKGANAGLAVIHELTHVYAVSAYRKQKKNGYEDRFFDDGIAVFLQHRFGAVPEYPDFGHDLYRAVAVAATEYGQLIRLAEAENVRHSAKTGLGRKLAYLQEGAFTQFLIERFGLTTYLEIYAGADVKVKTGYSLIELEKQWVTLISVFMS
ncbi:hypothetical protein [Pseudoalteromonas sp. MMG005]|uniref:hypothetical protein n=1 Tax=Pseudoalteromonas sp. MMG005 TaxID=2822682 RepID=UPI001B3A1530|nr:hypothetical protein [Pseudoalteromonas sp. MMG005]MBQ4847952.1 hypothetical protein [Pseudoalteromonas sp. MMG005]